MKKYDAIIIGAGQAGVPLSKRLAKAGSKTALVEQAQVGGTCVNYGCTPTKTMIASAKAAYEAGRGKEFGINVDKVSVDLPAIIDRKNKIVISSREGTEKDLTQTNNLDLVYGEAVFTGEKTISVKMKDGNTEEWQADYFFIDTGARTSIPEIDGLDKVPYLTSTSILDQQEVPEHLLVLGGSYIGLEFGQMFSRFGSKVTIIDTAPRFLIKEDEDVAEEMKKILIEEGIVIHTNTKAIKVEQLDNKQINVTIKGGDKEQAVTCSHILVAAGRAPNTDKLALDKTKVETDDKGYIKVNDKLETSVQGVYALGDVKGGPAFTHISYNDYIIVCKNILEKQNRSTKDRPVPYCMFTDPQLGRVGMTEEEARKKGLNIKVAKLQMEHVARGRETGNTKGLMKAIVDAGSDKILGVAILGEEGGEIMSVLEIAMIGGLTCKQLEEMVFAHPTYSESINNLFMSLNQ